MIINSSTFEIALMPLDHTVRPAAVFGEWRELQPTPLPAGREAREQRAAQKLARRSPSELCAITQARALLVKTGLHKFKHELTHNRWSEMIESGKELKSGVHSLRISLRAQNLHGSTYTLPSRAVQWEHARLPKYALAWAHTIDLSLQDLGHYPGPLIVMWNMQCHISPLPVLNRLVERSATEMLRRDRLVLETQPQPSNQAFRQAQARKQSTYHQGLLLDELTARIESDPGHASRLDDTRNYMHVTDAVGRLRAVVLAYQHPSTPLPPHPEQYTVAGSTWFTNRRHWREAMREWLSNVDEAHPPAYSEVDRGLPSYCISEWDAPPYRKRARALSAPWELWPKRLVMRSLSMSMAMART